MKRYRVARDMQRFEEHNGWILDYDEAFPADGATLEDLATAITTLLNVCQDGNNRVAELLQRLASVAPIRDPKAAAEKDLAGMQRTMRQYPR